MTDLKKLCQRFYKETARIENMILLASVLAEGGVLPDVVTEEFLQSDDVERCFGQIPPHIDFEDDEAVSEWLVLNGWYGFLLQFATPVMRPWKDEEAQGRSYSWGYYRTRWVYGNSLEEALAKGFAWVYECRRLEVEGES